MTLPALKNSTISALILQHMAAGKTQPEAIDAVLGAGTYERLAGELYERLRAKAAQSPAAL